MHWIKTYVLEQLLYEEFRRNRDLRPPKVESNLFQYHLLQLQKDDYVSKTPQGYTLAAKGLTWADKYSSELKDIRLQTKFVTIIALKNDQGQYLLIPKARQPFVGKLYFPSGKIRQGEPLKEAAEREACEKLGLKSLDLKEAGYIRICIKEKEHIVTDFVGFIFKAATPRNMRIPEGSQWYDGKNVPEAMPSTAAIAEMLFKNRQTTEQILT